MTLRLGLDLAGPKSAAAAGPPAPPLPANVKMAVIGDSMTYAGFGTMIAYWMWLIGMMSGRAYFPRTINFGTTSCEGAILAVSGETSAQIAARTTAMVNVAAGVYIILLGENDGDSVTLADQKTNVRTILNAIHSLVTTKRIYIIPQAPTKGVFGSATRQTRNAAYATWIEAPDDAVGAPYAKCRAITNAWSGITLATDPVTAGPHSYDGTHMNPPGSKALALNIWAEAEDDFVDEDAYDAPYASNLNSVSTCTGSGGSQTNLGGVPVTGAAGVATGYVGSNATGITGAASKVSRDGHEWQRVEILGTSTSGSNLRARMRRTQSTAIDGSDIIVAMCRVKVSNVAGNGPPVGLRGLGIKAQSDARWMSEAYNPSTGDAEASSNFEYIIRTLAYQVTSTVANFTIDVDCQVDASSSCDIAIEFTDLEVFNLTDEGLA